MHKKSDIRDFFSDIFSVIIIAVVVAAILIFILVNSFMFTIVPTSSMEPTIRAKSFALSFTLPYKLGADINRQTIVILEHDNIKYCKRVIGTPGDKINISNGGVFVNDILLNETDYLNHDVKTEAEIDEFIVPENCYFVMGDNRESSLDSRQWDEHYIPREKILGKVIWNYDFPTR